MTQREEHLLGTGSVGKRKILRDRGQWKVEKRGVQSALVLHRLSHKWIGIKQILRIEKKQRGEIKYVSVSSLEKYYHLFTKLRYAQHKSSK